MVMRKTLPALLLTSALALVFACRNANAADDNKSKEAAIAAAKSWLALVDGGDHGRSWDEAASYFKANITRDAWTKMVAGVRGPLGKVRSRSVKVVKYATTLPGAPDGEYYVIQFATSFEGKDSAIETITPMKEKDGSWRVSGYFIK